MGFLDRFFGSSGNRESASPDRYVNAVDAASIVATGRRRKIEIVGERFRQEAFTPIVGPKSREQSVNYTTTAALVPEPANREDKNAVQVIVEGRHVGYLSREQAVGYHGMMKELGQTGRALGNIEARIYGGRIADDGFERAYEVAIYLPESLASKVGYLEW